MGCAWRGWMAWLDSKAAGSIMYLSFGSHASMGGGTRQWHELAAMALQRIRLMCLFLAPRELRAA